MRPCGPLLSRVPAFLDFSFAFQVPAFLYNIFLRSPVLLHFCFAFLCSCANERMCGVGVQLITHVLYVYGRIRWAGSTCHRATHNPPGHECIVSKYCILAGSQFGVKLISCLQSPPSTSPLHLFHIITVLSLHRNANLAFLFFRIPVCSAISGTQDT